MEIQVYMFQMKKNRELQVKRKNTPTSIKKVHNKAVKNT